MECHNRSLLLPRAGIAERAATRAVAGTTEVFGEVLHGDLSEKLVLIGGADDVDLGDGNFVEPTLDDVPDGREGPRCVDDVELAHRLRVAVLADRRRLENVILDAVEVGERHAREVEDRARRLDRVARRARACGEAVAQAALVLPHEPLQLTVDGGEGVQSLDVEFSKTLDVYWPPVLRRL